MLFRSQPDILLCRCDREIPVGSRKKIGLFCNIREEAVIQALDARTIYEVPLRYHDEGFDREVLRHFGLDPSRREPDLSRWQGIVKRIVEPEGEVEIAVVGKYTNLLDAYKSLAEALAHGGIHNNVKVKLNWLEAELFENGAADMEPLASAHGILEIGRAHV